MKVKCMKNYTDLVLGRMVKRGEVLEVSEERAEELTTANNKSGYILCAKVAEPEKAEEVAEEVQESAEEVQEVAQESAEEVQEPVEEAEEVEEAPAKKTRKKKEV